MIVRSVLAGAAALVLVVSGGSAGAATESADGNFLAVLKAYDPGDALRLPGDTHLLHIEAYSHNVFIEVEHFACGPHDRLAWPVAGCTGKGWKSFPMQEPRLDVVADDTLRLRGASPAGYLDVTMTGPAEPGYLSHDLSRTVGTRRETREIVTHHAPSAAPTAESTLGGVKLVQPQSLRTGTSLTSRTTTTDVTTVEAVPVPELPPAGTRAGDVVTEARGLAFWSRRLPQRGPRGTLDVEVGRLQFQKNGERPFIYAEVQRQRCRPGQNLRTPVSEPKNPCAVLGAKFGAETYNGVVDLRNARLHVVMDLQKSGGYPPFRVDLTWRGRDPLGVVEVERTRGAVHWFRSDRTGVRWASLTVTGKIAGKAVSRTWGGDFFGQNVRTSREPL